jgi:uncharacterized membrane protein YuzA (DUF378 family)
MMIAAMVAMTALLTVGLIGFFADPLHLPAEVLGVLDQRASVVSMFIGAAGLMGPSPTEVGTRWGVSCGQGQATRSLLV